MAADVSFPTARSVVFLLSAWLMLVSGLTWGTKVATLSECQLRLSFVMHPVEARYSTTNPKKGEGGGGGGGSPFIFHSRSTKN